MNVVPVIDQLFSYCDHRVSLFTFVQKRSQRLTAACFNSDTFATLEDVQLVEEAMF